jgi:hypothetical protein
VSSAHTWPSWPGSARLPEAPLLGWLPDGTPHHAPVGIMVVDGDLVCCHLCGRWFLSVASHLRAHGWTKADYIKAFGLEVGNSLAGEATRKRRSVAMIARQGREPAVQEAQCEARARARSGALTASAAAAARGRPHPVQRRPKTMAALSAVSREANAAAIADHAKRHLEQVAAEVAARFGFADFSAYVIARLSTGASLAAISREAGLHKDWLSRHLSALSPGVAGARRELQPDPMERRWRLVSRRLGFPDAETYLRTRHVEEHRTVNAIAEEAGLTRAAVRAALLACGVPATAHAAKRHEAGRRDRLVSRGVGFASTVDYITDRRSRGFTWKAMAAEIGMPETSLRRRSGVTRPPA